eukprot:9998511-Alexandrium_andersonii.AAC.1
MNCMCRAMSSPLVPLVRTSAGFWLPGHPRSSTPPGRTRSRVQGCPTARWRTRPTLLRRRVPIAAALSAQT